eukprot:scaffold16716_cov134-Isochrysis_galbana.AAC.10
MGAATRVASSYCTGRATPLWSGAAPCNGLYLVNAPVRSSIKRMLTSSLDSSSWCVYDARRDSDTIRRMHAWGRSFWVKQSWEAS